MPDRWCLELTCCYDITTETLGSPQKPTPTLETAKREIPRLEVPTESAELQQIIDKLFKPTVRDPGSEPRTCQLIRNICHRRNVYEEPRFDSGNFRPNVFVAREGTKLVGRLGQIGPFFSKPFPYSMWKGLSLFLLGPGVFLPNLTEGSEGKGGPPHYYLLLLSNYPAKTIAQNPAA